MSIANTKEAIETEDLTTDVAPVIYGATLTDLKALAASHTRLLLIAKQAADNPGDDGYGENPAWVGELKVAIEEAEK